MHIIKDHRWLTALLLLGFVLSACAPAAPAPPQIPSATPTPTGIIIVDGLGRENTLDAPALRVASLAPSNTEILFAIGAGAQVVARDSFSDFPEQAKAIADIGGGFGEIDTETLISLKPDLVLAAEINPVEKVQMLEELGLKVFYLSNPKDLDGLYENLRSVARLVGREAEAEALVESLELRVSAVEGKIAGVQERPLVFYELDSTDSSAPWTPGPGTFIDLLLSKAGGNNLGNILNSEWAQISVEELITQNPEVILLGDYTWGGVTPEDVAARPGWQAIAAVQKGQVYPFDDNLVSRPGPRMVDGLEALAKLLHPELFE